MCIENSINLQIVTSTHNIIINLKLGATVITLILH